MSSLASKKSDWTPKYAEATLKKLKSKIKPTARATKTKSTEVAKNKSQVKPANALEKMYLRKAKSKAAIKELKAITLQWKQKAVPTLLKVMKSKNYPDENRWVATFMLGRIMGVKSADYISKFTKHPNWMLRLASLKVLLHLKQTKYQGIYARMLGDKSMIIRHQALQNIRDLKIKKLAPFVWKMLYNKSNYVGLKGNRKRSSIIKDAIKTVGELDFKNAKKPMLKMMQGKKYKDVYEELDYSLSMIVGKTSPKGNLQAKKHFWNRIALKDITI
jgi:hypothetical protein